VATTRKTSSRLKIFFFDFPTHARTFYVAVPSESRSAHRPIATLCLRLLIPLLRSLVSSFCSNQPNDDMALPEDVDAVGETARLLDMRHAAAAV
jgi:hypothetical protein